MREKKVDKKKHYSLAALAGFSPSLYLLLVILK
jgi:hypothetical protein